MSLWHVLLVALAGWLNREQQKVIDYLKEENRVLREQLGDKRLRFTDEQRRRLAVKGKELGIKILREGGLHRHAGHDPSLVPRAHRHEVRRQ